MTADELALVAAVNTTPADDTPRLAYADWLDEHAGTVDCFCKGRKWKQPDPCHRCNGRYGLSDGRRERAEFIRVQCEIATVGPTDSVRGKLVPLQRRERELLVAHESAWRGSPLNETEPMGHWLAGRNQLQPLQLADKEGRRVYKINCEFRRGFVEEVRCSAADWLAHADALVWRPDWTDECPHGKGKCNIPPWCRHCRDANGLPTGRVPRPLHPTAQPIRRVVLTALPPGNPTWDDMLTRFRQEWKWIEFSRA